MTTIVIAALLLWTTAILAANNGFFDKHRGDMLLRQRRVLRELKRYEMHFVDCCNFTRTYNNATVEKGRQMEKECAELVLSKTANTTMTDQMHENQDTCFANCIFQKFNWCSYTALEVAIQSDADGNMIQDSTSLPSLSDLLLIESESIRDKINSLCYDISKERAKAEVREFECSRVPLQYLICAFDVRNWYCPDDKKRQDEMCVNLRAELKNVFKD